MGWTLRGILLDLLGFRVISPDVWGPLCLGFVKQCKLKRGMPGLGESDLGRRKGRCTVFPYIYTPRNSLTISNHRNTDEEVRSKILRRRPSPPRFVMVSCSLVGPLRRYRHDVFEIL